VVVAAGKAPSPILQREEAVAQDQGRKRRMTGAAAGVAAAGKEFLLIADDDEEVEVSATEGGGDERGAAGVCSKNPRLRVMKTLRAFSTNYLHFVQVSLLTMIFTIERQREIGGSLPGWFWNWDLLVLYLLSVVFGLFLD
jgi:euchromatic histone-lysine N-methyltransferase